MSPVRSISSFGGGVSDTLVSKSFNAPPEPDYPVVITSLSFYVTGVIPVTNSIQGYNIKLFNSLNYDLSLVQWAQPIAGQSRVTVYKDLDTTATHKFSQLGEARFDFGTGDGPGQSNSFVWDKTNQLIIETCSTQNLTGSTTTSSSRVLTRSYSADTTNSMRYYGDNVTGSACSYQFGNVAGGYMTSVLLRGKRGPINFTAPIAGYYTSTDSSSTTNGFNLFTSADRRFACQVRYPPNMLSPIFSAYN